MVIGSINWLAVIVCVAVSMVTGSLWYNPKTFFPIWWKGIGKKESDLPGSTGPMWITWALTVLASFIQALFMAHVVNVLGGREPGGATLVSGAATGFVIWLGFIAPTYLVNKLFAGQGFKVWAIEVGNHLLNFLLFGAILGAWH
jgi:hypothetical protein